MTDEEIDGLSGTTLNEAVARQLGWTQPIPKVLPNVWDDEDGESLELTFASDLGAAMSLLLTLPTEDHGWAIDFHTEFENGEEECHEVFAVYSEVEGRALASGSKDQAATVLCRAFLKMKNR